MQFLIALDQLLNTLLFWLPGGCWADESFSARCWRCRAIRPFTWLQPVVDVLFFFDRWHCFNSYSSELIRSQSPPEERAPQKSVTAVSS